MTIAAFAQGTQSATVTTEHFLSSPNVVGNFRLLVKLSNLVAGDRLELRQYKIPLTGGSTVSKLVAVFEGAQPTDDAYFTSEWLPNELTDTNSVRYSLKQTYGTTRNFDWVVFRETDQADVTKWNGTAVASPHTAGYPVVTIKDGTGTGEIDTLSGKVLLQDDSIGASTIVDSGGNALTFVTAADVAAAVANLALASYTTPGSLSDFIQDSYTLIAALPTAAAIADAVLDEDMTAHQTQGTLGQAIGDPVADADTIWGLVNTNLNATISSRASQTSLDTVDDLLDTEIAALTTAVADVPTNAELATALGTADDATLAAIAALNNLSQANVRTAVGLASANLDTQLDALPTNAELATSQAAADDATLAAIAALNNLSAAQVNAEVDTALADYDAPTNAEMVARTLATASYATAAALDAVDNFVDTEMTAVKAVTDKLDTALELDGAVYRYTTNALEQAPTSGGSGGLTAAETRAALGMTSANMDAQLAVISAKTSLITANNFSIISPVNPHTGDFTLYDDTDYTVASGTTLPTWSSDDWTVFDLSNAASITLYYRPRGSYTDTALGTVTALSDTSIRFTANDTDFAAVPYGNKASGFKIVAVLDVAHGSAEVVLVNSSLSHFNYREA